MRILPEYVSYYHSARTHLSLDKDAPDLRPIVANHNGDIVAIPMVGGLHHKYIRRVAIGPSCPAAPSSHRRMPPARPGKSWASTTV